MKLQSVAAFAAPFLLVACALASGPKHSRRASKPAEAPALGATAAPPAPQPRPSELLRTKVAALPPAPEGVSDLCFDEFFKLPVGPKGLEITERLKSLHGQQVRILGFMVKQARATPWTLLLAPMPLISHEGEFGLAEDLPPTTVRVILPRTPAPVTPFTPGLLLLTGRLEVGDQEEADGRHSLVRLHLGLPASAQPPDQAAKPPISAPDSNRR